MNACARSNVDDVVGCANHVFVVLYDQHTVTEIAEVFEGANQAIVVALMQTNRGLIQNIHHAG